MTNEIRLEKSISSEIVERSHDPIVIFDGEAHIAWANDAVSLLGWQPSDLVGRPAFDLLEPADVKRALDAVAAINQGHRPPSSAPYEILAADGTRVECDVAGWPIEIGDGETGIAVHVRPTQDSRVLRELLKQLLGGAEAAELLGEMLQLLYHRNPDVQVAISFVDEYGVGHVVGDQLDPRLAGVDASPESPWRAADATGEHVVVEGVDGLPAEIRSLASSAGLRDCWVVPVAIEDEQNALITLWVLEGGAPVGVDIYSMTLLESLIELVMRWRRQAIDLERAATRDPLTGLPNRRALGEFDASAGAQDLGVLYIDLDWFKPVNDRLGHDAGDQVLRVVALRLLAETRQDDFVTRLGGDEFGIVTQGLSKEELDDLAGRIGNLIAEPIEVRSEAVIVGCSIGAAMGDDSAGALLALADRALYDAKAAGRGKVLWAN